MHKNYHWQWVDTFHGGRNIDIFEGRKHLATVFSEEDAKRIITALRIINAMRDEREKAVKIYYEKHNFN
jgi:hypothetical protein